MHCAQNVLLNEFSWSNHSTAATRYTLPGPASWQQPAEGCSRSDHRGTAAVHTAGAALWYAGPGSAWPTQVGHLLH